MGWAERLNPNSEWNKKRRPPIIAPAIVAISKTAGFWHRLIKFIQKKLDNLVHKG